MMFLLRKVESLKLDRGITLLIEESLSSFQGKRPLQHIEIGNDSDIEMQNSATAFLLPESVAFNTPLEVDGF